MSIEAVAWALSQPVEHSSAKFVLVVLANHADSDGICWPSIQSISDSTAQDRKTVIANLKRLVEMGWITDTGMRKGTTNQVPVYRLNSTKNGTVEQSQKREPYKAETVPFFPMNSTVFPYEQYRFSVETVPKTGHGTISEPSTEPSRKEKTTRDKPASVDWQSVLQSEGVTPEVAADYLRIRKAKGAPLSATALAGLKREAEKAGVTLQAGLEECCTRGWQAFKADWLQKARASPVANREDSRRAAGLSIFGNLEEQHGRIFDVTPAAPPALGGPDFP